MSLNFTLEDFKDYEIDEDFAQGPGFSTLIRK